MSSIGYSYGSAWIGPLSGGRIGTAAKTNWIPRLRRGRHQVGGGHWIDITWLRGYVGLYGLGR